MVLHGQALATLSTTGSQYLAPTLGGHTSTETVSLRTLALIGLISALHIVSLSLILVTVIENSLPIIYQRFEK